MKTKYFFFSFLFFFTITFVSAQEDVGAPLEISGIIKYNEKPLEAVNIVVSKGGKQLENYTTTKNGRFNFDVFSQSTTNKNSIYKIVFSKPGYLTKTLEVNTYIPPEDYDQDPAQKELLVEMIATKFDKVQFDRPFAKMVWQRNIKVYDIDASYAKTVAADEALLKKDPDKFLQELKDKQSKPVNPAEEKYKNDIALADRAFDLKNWELAKNLYNDALKAKPNDKYSKDKIALIDIELAKVSNASMEKENKAKYDAVITKGNTAFNAKKYEDAKKAYTEALTFKAGDVFATNKIKECNDKMGGVANNEKALYEAAVAKGATALAAKKYPEAKLAYTQANKIRPTEQLPKTKLIEIQTALDAIAKTEKENKAKYDAAIAKGNTAFTAKNYDAAKLAYNQALALKQNDPFSQSRIKEINDLQNGAVATANTKAEKAKYDLAITKADAAFNEKKYEDAITGYEEALEVKPNETYPKERIAKADEIIEAEKNKNAPVVLAEPVFDGAKTFSVSKEKQIIQEEKRKLEKKKAQNLSIKYETRNVSTSLLDAVDAFDKKNKNNK